ncbi:hypothetical protein JL722_6131 [Aureococcus anophagefferens]|nr:hypothetical protein JL722_6131 [Aureococcus anophagefferens]
MNAEDQQLEAVLVALTAPDTSRIKQAEDALKPVLKKSACVGALMTQVASSGNVAVRQIAAVILRKKIVKLWKKLKKSAQTRVKAAILERLGSEPERAVRKSVAALASALAKVLVPHNKWPELLAFISQCATAATSPQHRELAYLLLLQLSETVATSLSSQLGQLAQLFRAALGDEERAVSVMALRACCAFVSTLSTDDDAMLFRDLVPPMVAVATPVPVLAPHVGDVVPLLLDVMRAGDDDLERATRDGAASVIGALAEWKPKLLGKRLRQEEAALAKAAKIAAGQVVLGGDDDDDEAYEGPSSQEVAQTTLDQIALHVPLKWSLEPTLGLAMQCLEDANPSTRRAGAAAVGVVAEGFQDALREHHLGEVLQRLANAAAANSEPATRECLCFAYGQLAEHCQPEIVGHAAAVVPVVFEFLNDARAAVVGTSCYVLEMFCESMDASQLGQLLEPLMARLLPLLGHQLLGIREMAAAAVGSAAIAAADGFGPYLDVAAPPLAAMCELGEERAWELRGRSLEALGHVALAVGAARFAPYRDRALAAAAQNLELDSTELAEYSYGFFANAAKVMRGDFGPLLPQLVPHLLDVVARKDGASLDFADDDEDDEGGGGFDAAFLEDGDDDDEEPREPGDADEWEDDVEDEESDDDLAGHAVMTVRTAMMNVKRAAIVALGNVAEYTEGHFAPHLDKSLDVLRVMVDYFHHEIRERSAIALQQLAHAACVAHGGSARALPYAPRTANDDKEPVAIAWAKGDGAASLPSPQLATYVNACVGLLAPGGGHGQPIVEATLQLANKQAPCQTLLGADDDVIDAVARGTHEEGDDDDEDHDNVLMDNVADLCGAVAKVGGGLVGHGTADAVFQAFAKYAQPARAASDRAMALGCFAELCVELPPDLAAGRHFAQLWGLFSSACGDAHSNVARNAAFGVGALFSAAGPAFARQHIPDALHALYPLVTKADGAPPERAAADRAAADNALAAMCRIAQADLEAAPVDQVLALVLPKLPLAEDAGENATVMRLLLALAAANHAALAASAPRVKAALQATLAQDKIDDADIVAQCTELLAKLG